MQRRGCHSRANKQPNTLLSPEPSPATKPDPAVAKTIVNRKDGLTYILVADYTPRRTVRRCSI